MKITFYAHASFRLEHAGLVVITDPYTPGPTGAGFAPINEPADVVVMSSATDRFHNDPSHVRGTPVVVNALDIPPKGMMVHGLQLRAFPVMESLTHDFGRNPDTNAMYTVTLGGVRVLHMGDMGNPLSEPHLAALQGVDLLLALTGGKATIGLDDLATAIAIIQPRVVIPMHYFHPRGVLDILPVTAFTARYPAEHVTCVDGPTLELTPDTLPPALRIVVLTQSR